MSHLQGERKRDMQAEKVRVTTLDVLFNLTVIIVNVKRGPTILIL